ncbi:PRTRC system ThiF family protein [Spirosoma fluviale]|uniref:PRTRC system ThiF family protein n=1 Tax=Spirosoma fluviale TaxID=1597977 RepID=A0A286FCB4_9BACT|nr:PRTRC system ThiF family protein [Spirosoma fluviale]SOD80833.1 PRTRC system ThiF family protein [Spirosoma fluviale]
MNQRIHYTDKSFLNPQNPLTVYLIGAGGTGSQVITGLARMNHALIELGHPGLHVTLWDDDVVSEANLGRQLFAEAELGHNKATVLINRVNRFFGTNWKAKPMRYTKQTVTKDNREASLMISCVDSVAARFEIADILKVCLKARERNFSRSQASYWMDFGNAKNSGQLILATVGPLKQPTSEQFATVTELPFITDEFGGVLASSEADDDTPSCSVAEALRKQDLFINSTIAQMGCKLLWTLFREGRTHNRGFFLNLSDFRANPIKV